MPLDLPRGIARRALEGGARLDEAQQIERLAEAAAAFAPAKDAGALRWHQPRGEDAAVEARRDPPRLERERQQPGEVIGVDREDVVLAALLLDPELGTVGGAEQRAPIVLGGGADRAQCSGKPRGGGGG